MKKRFIVSLMTLTLTAGLQLSGQVSEFTPTGKPIFLVFSNVNYAINRDGNSHGFEITRLYLGYEYSFSKNFSARANIDVGDPGVGGLQMTAYVKNAFMQYKTGDFTGRIGMIGTDQYNLIEKQWGYRYIFKTLQDEFGFGPSADLGAAVEYSLSDFISLDASVLNGEGYKKVQSDSIFKYTMGITIRPAGGLVLRGYTDFMKKDFLQNTISLFAGYTYKNFSAGLEYSHQENTRMISQRDFDGISAFASLRFGSGYSVFARYDDLGSSIPEPLTEPWNYGRDGRLFMGGFEFSPVKGIRIAPVYMGWMPDDKAEHFTSAPGIHFEIKL